VQDEAKVIHEKFYFKVVAEVVYLSKIEK